MATAILVFIPGTLGSELWNGDDKVWPGSAWDAIRGFSDERFQKLRQPGLEPRDVIRSAAGGFISIYDKWLEAFEGIARDGTSLFREHPENGQAGTLRVFPYDWRIDLRITADRLAGFLDAIVAGTPDADLKLVGHSMGGLIARYYLESGRFSARAAHARVSLLVTLGTPHNGAPAAFAAAVGLRGVTFLSLEQTRVMANDPRYTALYQLFPDRTHSFIWDRDAGAAIGDRPADDQAIATRFGLHRTGLDAWNAFRAALSNPRPAHVRYFFIVGSRQATIARLSWDGTALAPVELDDSGDGTVSLLGAVVGTTQSEFVGKSHVSLIDTPPAQQTLAALFGATLFGASTFAAEAAVAPAITLAVRDLSVTTEDEVHVQIDFHPEIDHFTGELRFERALGPGDGQAANDLTFTAVPQLASLPIELTGRGFSYVNVKADPLEVRGIYRPVLEDKGNPARITGPAFAVQAR